MRLFLLRFCYSLGLQHIFWALNLLFFVLFLSFLSRVFFKYFHGIFDCAEVITWLPDKTNSNQTDLAISSISPIISAGRFLFRINRVSGSHTICTQSKTVVLFSIKYFECFFCIFSNFLKTASVMSILGFGCTKLFICAIFRNDGHHPKKCRWS